VQVNAQLIDAESGAHLWAERLEATASNLLDLQNQVTDCLARELGLQLVDAASRRSLQERPSSPDVEDLLLRGEALWNKPVNRKRNEDLRTLYEGVLKLDPKSGYAWVELARVDATNVATWLSNDRMIDMQRAQHELDQATALAPSLPLLHSVKGQLHYLRKKPDQAASELQAYLDLEPSYAGTRAFIAFLRVLVD
jgi:adenylate cyclase